MQCALAMKENWLACNDYQKLRSIVLCNKSRDGGGGGALGTLLADWTGS